MCSLANRLPAAGAELKDFTFPSIGCSTFGRNGSLNGVVLEKEIASHFHLLFNLVELYCYSPTKSIGKIKFLKKFSPP